MKLYLGNCLARYFYYKDSDPNTRYKWCTNFHYLENPSEALQVLAKENVLHDSNRYVELLGDQDYKKIIFPMSQFLVRDFYVKRDSVYAELGSIDSSWIVQSKELEVPYPEYFLRAIEVIRQKHSNAELVVLLKMAPPSKEIEGSYGDYASQFNEATLMRSHYESLNSIPNLRIIDKQQIAEQILKIQNDWSLLFPWFSYDGKRKSFYRDLNHYSEFFINTLFSLTQEKETPDFSEAFQNRFDRLGFKILNTESIEELFLLFNDKKEKVIEALEEATQFYLGKKDIQDYLLTLNISGFQNLAVNLCYQLSRFQNRDNFIYEGLQDFYLKHYGKAGSGSPLSEFYEIYLEMLRDFRKQQVAASF